MGRATQSRAEQRRAGHRVRAGQQDRVSAGQQGRADYIEVV